jgi:hypothetical protein
MLGKLPKTGTGVFDIKIDTEKLIKNHKNVSFNEKTDEKKEEKTKETRYETIEEKKDEKKDQIISIKSKKMKKVNSLCI